MVAAVAPATPRARLLQLEVPGWLGHRAGDHVDVRLTAEDGYQAQRSYSVASAPGADRLELVVERLEDGEVSPYLVDVLRPGDVLELRGPIGGAFVWDPDDPGPLMLVGGGSGVVPLVAMLRHHAALASTVPARLLLSARAPEDILFAGELDRLGAEVTTTLTRERPAGFAGYARRVDAEMLRETGFGPERNPAVFVCGPTGFVEAVADALVALGHRPERIRTERFGPTGT